MGIILKARKVLKKTVLYQLYNSFVFPYRIYCSEVWGTASNIHLQPLINLQKKIIRMINFSPYNSPTKLIFQELNILPFKNLYFIELVSKCLNMNLALCQLLFKTYFAKKTVLFILTTLGTKISSVLQLLSMHTEIKISDLFMYIFGITSVIIVALMLLFLYSNNL